jgi:putative protease
MPEEEIGRVTHYFGKIGVAAIELTAGSLAVGDRIRIKGHTSDFTEVVGSMQIDNQPVQHITAGQSAALKITQHARTHDTVYKVTD